MNRNKKAQKVSYTLAAGLMAGAAALTGTAAPLAGASKVLSTAKVETASESTASSEETASSYSTISGVNRILAQMVASANTQAATATSAETTAVAAGDQTAAADASAGDAAAADTAAADQAAANQAAAAEASAPVSEYANIAVSQVSSYVNVRAAASEDAEVVGKLYNNCAATVLGTEGEWYQISSGNCTGYVKGEYVVVGDENLARSVGTRLATVATETLYIRKDPSTDATCLGMVPGGDDLVVTDESLKDQGWIKVSYEDSDAYVAAAYVTLSTEYKYAETVAEEQARIAAENAEKEKAAAAAAAAASSKKSSSKSSSNSSSSSSSSSSSGSRSYSAPSGSGGSAVVSYATQFVGNPYVYGGSSLTNGADCSGFVMSVYKQFGVSLPHSSSADRSVGYGVSTSEMQPGDIVCYSGHVAIYAGNGQIVHAQSKKTGIVVSSVNSGGGILAVRRIF